MIKNFYKYIIGCLILSLYVGFSIAYNDCLSLTMDGDNYIKIRNGHYENIFSDEEIKKAFDHLKFFCCDKKIIGNNCTQVDEHYPSSAILFDHMLDIYLRKLDAKQENKNGDDLIYGLQPDEMGSEWRDYITEIGNSSSGAIPVDVVNHYKQYWTSTPDYALPAFDNYISDLGTWSTIVSEKVENFGDWSLGDKYINSCDVIMRIYHNINTTNTWGTQLSSSINTELISMYKSCKTMVQNRINSEYYYVETLTQQKSNNLLFESVNTYLSTYFLEAKLSTLQTLIYNTQTLFSEIVKGVPRLVHLCS